MTGKGKEVKPKRGTSRVGPGRQPNNTKTRAKQQSEGEVSSAQKHSPIALLSGLVDKVKKQVNASFNTSKKDLDLSKVEEYDSDNSGS